MLCRLRVRAGKLIVLLRPDFIGQMAVKVEAMDLEMI